MNKKTQDIIKRIKNINDQIKGLSFVKTDKPQKELFLKILSVLQKTLKYLKKNNANRKTKY